MRKTICFLDTFNQSLHVAFYLSLIDNPIACAYFASDVQRPFRANVKANFLGGLSTMQPCVAVSS